MPTMRIAMGVAEIISYDTDITKFYLVFCYLALYTSNYIDSFSKMLL